MKEWFKRAVFWIHFIEIILVWLSPLFISWYIIIICIILNYAQVMIVGGCILTKIQYGKKNKKAYYTYFLEKIGFKPKNDKVIFFVDNIKPYIILLLALVLQLVLDFKPLII